MCAAANIRAMPENEKPAAMRVDFYLHRPASSRTLKRVEEAFDLRIGFGGIDGGAARWWRMYASFSS